MNLYLHNIGDLYGKVPVMRGDALLSDPGYRVDYVLTNPPFGKKSSITFTNEEEEQEEEDLVYNRQDFWTTSSNKQLNFIQHINDFRTNVHFTLRQHPMTDADLQDFIQCYHPENRHERTETWSQENPEGRWRRFTVDEILERDKTSLDIFWLKDKSLADLDNLPAPDELAADIIENLQSALESFQELMGQLKKND